MNLLYNRFGYLLCTTLCLFFGSVPAMEQSLPEQIPAFSDEQPMGFSLGEQVAGGTLSPENKQYIVDIFKRMGVKSRIRLRRTLEALTESEQFPQFRTIYAMPSLGYCYVNEPWFNTLSEPEKRFVAGRAALDSLGTDFKDRLAHVGVLGAAFGAMYYVYKKLGEGLGEYKPGWCVKALSSGLAGVVCYKLADKLILQPLDRYNGYQKDKAVVEKLDCLDGALSVLQKLDDKNLSSVSTRANRIIRLKALKKA